MNQGAILNSIWRSYLLNNSRKYLLPGRVGLPPIRWFHIYTSSIHPNRKILDEWSRLVLMAASPDNGKISRFQISFTPIPTSFLTPLYEPQQVAVSSHPQTHGMASLTVIGPSLLPAPPIHLSSQYPHLRHPLPFPV